MVYWTELGLILWYIGLRLNNTSTTLLDSDCFYDILEKDLKSTEAATGGVL